MATEDATGQAGSADCCICMLPLTNNRCCPVCAQPFCAECLAQWVQAGATHTRRGGDEGKASGCPACRYSGDIDTYAHDAGMQRHADSRMFPCENECGATLQWGLRATHRGVCTGQQRQCPFGCGLTALVGDMDRHTVRCSYGSRLSIARMVQGVLDRSAAEPSVDSPNYRPAGVSDSALSTMLSQIQQEHQVSDAELEEEGLIRHFVVMGDSLSSLSVRYGTTSHEIQRLNNMASGNVFSRQFVLVPRPKEHAPEPEEISVAALVALRKRKLAHALMKRAKESFGRSMDMDESVTYLHMTDYDVDASFHRVGADDAWARRSTAAADQSETFEQFVQRVQRSSSSVRTCCSNCCVELTTALGRVHCSNLCGVFFCKDCSDNADCTAQVTKQALGATSPSAKDTLVTVCTTCAFHIYTSLPDNVQPGPAMASTAAASPQRRSTACH